MNIPPILERLLLSNEAVFKNASLGMSGQNMVYVPPGKTAVLLEVSIEPFINAVKPKFLQLLTNGLNGNAETTYSDVYRQAIQRMHYQLQIINDSYSTYINLNDKLLLNVVSDPAAILSTMSNLSLEFTGKREELFIYTDRSIYFNIIYPFKLGEEEPDSTGLIPTYGTPSAKFSPKIQTLPDSPITFNKNPLEDFVTDVEVSSPTGDHYYPVNYQTTVPNLPQMEYLRYINIENQNTIQQPRTSGTTLQWTDLFTIPFINVKYALINKRASDYGIVAPKNL
jgi:hypothetical protein